ncbi:17304_t:CDS:1, partial [Gigaspora rosea]
WKRRQSNKGIHRYGNANDNSSHYAKHAANDGSAPRNSEAIEFTMHGNNQPKVYAA